MRKFTIVPTILRKATVNTPVSGDQRTFFFFLVRNMTERNIQKLYALPNIRIQTTQKKNLVAHK